MDGGWLQECAPWGLLHAKLCSENRPALRKGGGMWPSPHCSPIIRLTAQRG